MVDAGAQKPIYNAGFGFGHVREVWDLRYGVDRKQQLDLYFPAGRAPLAALAFVHGGGWRTGDKNEYRYLGRALAQRGHAVAVIGYRLFRRCISRGLCMMWHRPAFICGKITPVLDGQTCRCFSADIRRGILFPW